MKVPNYSKELSLIENYLKDNNINIDFYKHPRIKDERGVTHLEEIEIDPKETGFLAPMFEEIKLNISYFSNKFKDKNDKENRITRLILKYSYNHPSSSNGYTVTLNSLNGSNFEIF